MTPDTNTQAGRDPRFPMLSADNARLVISIFGEPSETDIDGEENEHKFMESGLEKLLDAARHSPTKAGEPGTDAMRVIDPDQWEPCSPSWLTKHPNDCGSAPRVWNSEDQNHYHPKVYAAPHAPDSAASDTGAGGLAKKILGEFCACYAEAWPAKTCDEESRKLADRLQSDAEYQAAIRAINRMRDDGSLAPTTADAGNGGVVEALVIEARDAAKHGLHDGWEDQTSDLITRLADALRAQATAQPRQIDPDTIGDVSSLIAARCSALPGKLIDCPVCGAVDAERERQATDQAVKGGLLHHIAERMYAEYSEDNACDYVVVNKLIEAQQAVLQGDFYFAESTLAALSAAEGGE